MSSNSSSQPKRGKTYYLIRLAERGFTSLNGAACLINVSYPTILAMRDRGDITVIKVGGIFRVNEDEILRLQGKKLKPQG